jgi:hypothetical protein
LPPPSYHLRPGHGPPPALPAVLTSSSAPTSSASLSSAWSSPTGASLSPMEAVRPDSPAGPPLRRDAVGWPLGSTAPS